jgi:hemolysin activation/secretion protein
MKNLLIPLSLLFVFPVLALTPDQVAQQQQIILQQQEQQRQAEEQRREMVSAERIRDTRPADVLAGGADESRPSESEDECPRFTTIRVLGNNKYSDRRVAKITDTYIGRCITRDNMNALQNDLTALYIDRKYTLARVYFDQARSKLTRGDSEIVFIIEEGIINTVEFRDEYETDDFDWLSMGDNRWSRFRNTTKTITAVPNVVGDIFFLKDFEQGLDQINRLQSNNATIDIRPTPGLDTAGQSDIAIVNKHRDHRTTFFGMGLDNSGNKNVGEHNLNININQDNLLALNDNLYLKYTTDTDVNRAHHYSQSIYSALSIPFGYWTFNGSLSWSDYKTTVDGMYVSFHTWGDTLTQTYSLDRVLYRSARFRTNLGAALTIKDTENWIRDMQSITGTRRASNVNVFWNNTVFHPYGTLIIKPSYQRGLSIFGARHDPADIYAEEPHLQYDMLRLYLYSSMKFNLGLPITWNLTADGQYSFQPLYGTDQQSLGGEWTIRGFRENVISGDQGFYVRNDIRFPIWNLLPDALTNLGFMSAGGGWSANNMLGKTQIALFGDYGYVKNAKKILPDPYDSNSGTMAGMGAGLHYAGENFNWSLTYSYALASPEYLQTRDGIPKEEQSIYWRITANY